MDGAGPALTHSKDQQVGVKTAIMAYTEVVPPGGEPSTLNSCGRYGSRIISIVMYTVLDVRDKREESAAHVFDLAGVHIVIVQETKFGEAKNEIYVWRLLI